MQGPNASEYQAWMEQADMYEFGVYTGASLAKKVADFSSAGLRFRRLFGFDTFHGLPMADKLFRRGTFSAQAYFGAEDVDQTMEMVARTIQYNGTELVPGRFEESLTDGLPRSRGMGKAFWINVDCDLYASSLQALDWAFRNALVEPGRTHVYFDDGWYYRMHGMRGQVEAWEQTCRKYGVRATALLSTSEDKGGVGYFYRVDDLGVGDGHTGC